MIQDLEKMNLFEILGVDRKSTVDDLRRAYFKLRKKYTPEKNPIENRAIQIAFDCLYNPHSLQQYISLMSCGDDVADAMNRGYAAIILGQLNIAQKWFQRVVDSTNGSAQALFQMAMVQSLQHKLMTSANTLQDLVDRFPRDPIYHYKLGNVLLEMYMEETIGEKKSELLERARKQFRDIIEINETDIDPYHGMAHSYVLERNFDVAYEWIEKGTSVKKLDPFAKFPLYMYGCYLLAMKDEPDLISDLLIQIEDIIPNFDESRYYASSHMVDLCLQLLHDEKFDAMRLVALSAERVSPDSKGLSAFIKNFDLVVNCHHELKRLEDDQSVIKPIRELAHYSFRHYIDAERDDDIQRVVENYLQSLEKRPIREIRQSLINLRRLYPAVWKMRSEFWEAMINTSESRVGSGSPKSYIWIAVCLFFLILKLGSCSSNGQ